MLLVWLLATTAAQADALDDAFADDPAARALAVSSGELRFLEHAPAKPAHHLRTKPQGAVGHRHQAHPL